MRLAVLGLLLTAGTAAAAPDTIDMGKWDCSGAPTVDVLIKPGEHTYVWHGSCNGTENWSIVVDPEHPAKVKMRSSTDAKAKTLTLWVRNDGQIVAVKMHVFVGFA